MSMWTRTSAQRTKGMVIVVFVAALLALVVSAFRALTGRARLPSERPGAVSAFGLDTFAQRPIGNAAVDNPLITDLLIVDLDGDGWKDIIVCDARENRVSWIRQVQPHVFEEHPIGETIAGPAHVEVADMNGDGHLDVLVASMGVIPPSNAKTGAVVVLVNDGANHFTNQVLLENVARVTCVTAADLNEDKKLDLVVAQFGYIEGEIRWLENTGDGKFVSHQLLDLPGRFTRRWLT